MSLGKGGVLSSSMKQKINVNISTEGEWVVSHNGLIFVLWSKHFIDAQGYTMVKNNFYQDKNSTILMENNGRD